MFEVKAGNIFHTRGDTADFSLGVTVDGEPTTDYEGTFSIKKTLKDEAYLFTAPVVDGNVHISHEATKDLPFGRFFYDVQLRLNDVASQRLKLQNGLSLVKMLLAQYCGLRDTSFVLS